ncbi:hypothetical protein HYI36_05175 [Bacillus sp. Gen3]|nr:hypothetical protein [Bacillus sp. Gen3]
MDYDYIETKKCPNCNKEYKIGLKDNDMPYNDREKGKCPCGYEVSYKSRYITVDFIFNTEER